MQFLLVEYLAWIISIEENSISSLTDHSLFLLCVLLWFQLIFVSWPPISPSITMHSSAKYSLFVGPSRPHEMALNYNAWIARVSNRTALRFAASIHLCSHSLTDLSLPLLTHTPLSLTVHYWCLGLIDWPVRRWCWTFKYFLNSVSLSYCYNQGEINLSLFESLDTTTNLLSNDMKGRKAGVVGQSPPTGHYWYF